MFFFKYSRLFILGVYLIPGLPEAWIDVKVLSEEEKKKKKG